MTVPAETRKLRILCLHGYLQNAEMFRSRIGSMRKALKSRAEFFFMDAPYLVENATAEDAAESGGAVSQGRNWWQWSDIEPGTRPSRAASYTGWDLSQDSINNALEEHWPIDGLLGFSQGATAAGLFLAHTAEIPDRNAKKLPQWTVLIGGFMPRDVEYSAIIKNAAPINISSLHISGKKDALVVPARSAELWACFAEESRVVYEHEGAHMVPTCSGEFKQKMVEFLDGVKGAGLMAAAVHTQVKGG